MVTRSHQFSLGRNLLFVLTGLLLLSAPSLAQPAQGSCAADWIPTYGQRNGTDGYLSALVEFDDGTGPALFAAGVINVAGGVPVRGLAKWDGARWSAVLDTLIGDPLYPNALAVFDDGAGPALYVSGPFVTIDGVAASRIAKWDGSTWSSLGSGLNDVAYAMEVFDDGSGPALYVGGAFTTAGGVAASRIAKWDGASWSAIGSGVNSTVRALESWTDGDVPVLYVGGWFSSAGGVASRAIAKWDGFNWSDVGAGLESGAVYALEVHDDGGGEALFVGGNFETSFGAKSLAKWDTVAWSVNGLQLNGAAQSLRSFNDGSGPALFVGGTFTLASGVTAKHLAKLSGSTWTELGGGILGSPTEIRAFGVFDDGSGPRLYAGGWFWNIGGVATAGVARWDGTSWRALGEGLNQSVSSLAVFDDGSGPDLYVAGNFTGAGSVAADSLVRRSGGEWTAIGGYIAASVYSLAVHDDGSGPALYAGGSFYGSPTLSPNVRRWNGAQWSAVGAGLPQPVHAMASVDVGTGASLYAAGSFTLGASGKIARWDGLAWQGVGTGVNNTINALIEFDDGSGPALYAGGKFTGAGSVAARHVAKWDGVSWSRLGVGVDDEVLCLAVFDDGGGPALYAGGSFRAAGGSPANRVAKWDGTAWSPLGAGIGPYSVWSLAEFDDGGGPALFAGGRFSSAGGTAAYNLAKWDGQSWSAIPGLENGEARRLLVFDDSSGFGPTLHVGGTFLSSVTGDSYLASYGGCTVSSSGSAYCSAGTTSNGCTPSIGGAGTASASASSGFTITIANAPGATLGLFLYGVSGPQRAPWSTGSSFVCVRPPLQRLPPQGSGGASGQCNGTFAVDWNQFVAANPVTMGTPFAAGDRVWAQGWMRDGAAPAGASLSDGLVFLLSL